MPAQRGDDPRKAAGYKAPVGPPGNKVELHPPSPGRFHAGVPKPKPQHKAVGQLPRHAVGHEPERHAPIIPRVQHPNAEQVHAALQMAHAHQVRELGSAPTAAKIRAFQRRLPPDYLETVAHYVNAGKRLTTGATGVSGGVSAPGTFRHVRMNRQGGLELAPEAGKPAQDTSFKLLGAAEKEAVQAKKGLSILGHKIGKQTSLLEESQTRAEQVKGKYHPSIGVAFPAPAVVKFAAAAEAAGAAAKQANLPTHVSKELAEVGIVPLVVGERGIEAAGEFVKGNHKPLHDLLGQVGKAAKEGVIGHVVKGDIHGALQYAKNHLVFTAAELLAAKAFAGRAGGAVVRGAGKPGPGVRGKLHRMGSTTLDPYGHTGRYRPGMALEERVGSKDILAKGRQVAAQRLFHPVIRDAKGNPVRREVRGQMRTVREPGGRSRRFVPGFVRRHGGERLQQRRADFEVYRGQVRQANEIARVHGRMRHARNKQVGPLVIPFKKLGGKRPVKIEDYKRQGGGGRYMSHQNLATHLVPLVMRNEIRTVKSFKADLKARIDEIRDAIKKDEFSDDVQRETAKRNVAILQAAHDSPQVMGQAKKIVKMGETLGRHGVTADDAMNARFQIPAERSLRARLIPHAEKWMGATHYNEQQLAEAEARAKHEGRTRAEQIAVSGRDPLQTHLHEVHEARYAASKSALKTAQGRKDKAVARLKERTAAANRSKLKRRVVYHGTSAHPDEVLTKGINRQSYLAENAKHASTYVSNGGFLYEVDRRGLTTKGEGSEIKLEKNAPAGNVRLVPRTSVSVSHGDLQALRGRIPDALYKKLDTSSANHIISHAEAKVLAEAHPNEFVRRELRTWLDAYAKHKRDIPSRYAAADKRTLDDAKKEVARAHADLKAIRKMHTKTNAERIPLPERVEGFRKANGEHLSTDEIIADIKKSGRNPETVAYLPDTVEQGVNMDNFKASVGRRPSVGPAANLGILRKRGVSSFNPDIIEREFERKAAMTLRAQQLDKYVHEQGQMHPAVEKARKGETLTGREKAILDKGGYWSARDGGAQVKRINAAIKEKHGERRPGDEVVLFRAYPARTDRSLKPDIRNLQHATPMEDTAFGMLKERTDFTNDTGERNAVIVTKSQLERMGKHYDEGRRAVLLQQLMVPFRMAVLPQPKWLAGNLIEPFFIRLPSYGSGVWLPGFAHDIVAFKKGLKLLREGTPKQKEIASELEAQYGSMLSGSRTATETHNWQQFEGKKRAFMKVMHELRVAPVIKPLQDLALTPFKFFFELNRVMEGGIQRAAFGHQLRAEVADLTGSYGKALVLQKAALREVMNGFDNTAQQQRFFEATNEMLGKYNGWSPGMKRAVTTYTPFIPWAIAALKFVYWTLPVKHPVKFNALMKTGEQLMAEWEAEHTEVPPGELQYAQKIGSDEYRNWGKFGPIGATLPVANVVKGAAEGKRGESAIGELTQPFQYFIPPLQGPAEALRGRDFSENPLKDEPTPTNPKGDLSLMDRLIYAAKSVATESAPGVSIGTRIAEGSGSNYANSMPWAPKTKPGSEHGHAWERGINPIRTTKYSKKKKKGGGGLGSGGLGKTGLGKGGLGAGGLGQ